MQGKEERKAIYPGYQDSRAMGLAKGFMVSESRARQGLQ